MDKITHALNIDSCPGAAKPEHATHYRKKSRFLSRRMIAEIMVALDTISIFASGFAAKYVYIETHSGLALDDMSYFSVMVLVALGFHFVAYQRSLYNIGLLTNTSAQLSAAGYVWATTFASLFAALFFLKISDHFSRIWCLEWALLLLLMLATGRGIIIKFLRQMDRAGVLRRPVVLLGYGERFSKLRSYLSSGADRNYSLSAVLELPRGPEATLTEVQGAVAEFAQRAHELEADDIMIALPLASSSLTEIILREVQRVSADIHIVPDFGGPSFSWIGHGQLGDLSYITTHSKPIVGWGAFLKRVEDYLLAFIALILLAPLMAVIAIVVKLDSKGPVFFRQRRHGYNHRIIEVIKFRSMTSLDDGNEIVQVKRGDQRVTRVGRILRRTSLDELPQLINVLRGEMSIVGPRPHALAHNTYYGSLIENYANRHRVKPGITGWAQVHGFRGETEDPEKMAQRIQYDLAYIDNWTIWLDIKIILMTPLFGLFRKGAY
jgi:putative colanic acid biosynthesis UDP-glucose lipid carrier transferase